MDVTSQCGGTEGDTNTSLKQSECITSQPTANGILPHHNTVEEVPPPLPDRPEDGDSGNDSLTNSSSTNDIAPLLPDPLQKQKDTDRSSSPPPICTPPSSTFSCPPPAPPDPAPPAPAPPAQSSRHSCSLPHPRPHPHHHSTNQKRLSSTKSQNALKTDAVKINEVAGDDCCVQCVLGCLFCELLSMCSAVGTCLACGSDAELCCDGAACCCLEAAGEAACSEEACQAVLDCGIVEDCCSSSDFLEVCLECCSICFPT
ncbi:myoD family inhibitor [Scomber japonicus]|uniref:myoD family inhibitor n=1 Tax=Scomber japonicus TaxID=13676 RepID=UPI002305C50D|nr:myoD family inhibitor [Scomber japonicus]